MKTIYIEYSGMRPVVREAVCKANQLLRNDEFYHRIAELSYFDMADIAPEQVAWLMRNASLKMEVDLYYALSPINNIDLYDDEENPNIIHMNIWQLNRSAASICNTLLHSCVHAVNALCKDYYFGHGDSDPAGKELTAPYRIGAIAEEMIDGRLQTQTLMHDIGIPAGVASRELLRHCA